MAYGKRNSRKQSNRKFKSGLKTNSLHTRKPTRGGTRL
jgi:hypothetical protein